MRLVALLAILSALGARRCLAQEKYGAKGIYPVYEMSGQWLIFDKTPAKRKKDSGLPIGERFLVIGSKGSGLFAIARSSMTFGGVCKDKRPVAVRAALLRGPRDEVGSPIIGIRVPVEFTLKGSRAVYRTLNNQVTEDTYQALGDALKSATAADISSGTFKFGPEDNPPPDFLIAPKSDAIGMKIDFGSKIEVGGLSEPFVLVEGTQVLGTYRRCLRLADGKKLLGGCVEMPHALMAETALLQFVSYDPGGKGTPFVLAFTPSQPLWGHERWGFMIRASGPKLFLQDSMDIRCREGF